MLSKISLRLKLSDFINTDIEETVMDKINHIHRELHVTVLLYLWFEEDEITGTDLKEFLMRWEDKLTFKTVVKQTHKLHTKDFIFFDIIPMQVSDSDIEKLVTKEFDFRPNAIIKKLNLKRPIYTQLTSYGHFGRNGLPWERVNKNSKFFKKAKEYLLWKII